MSSLLGIMSLGTIYICSILEKIFPTMGKMASQFSVNAGYSMQEYIVNFTVLKIICCVILLMCFALSLWAYLSETKKGEK